MSLRNASKTKFLGLLPLFLLVVIGAFVRLRGISKESLWLDEAFSVFMSHLGIGEIIQATSVDNHPPLYYIILRAWTTIFGSSETDVRMLSFLFGIALIPLTYILGKRLFSGKVGIMGALFVTFSPILVWYSQEARSYTMLAFLCMLSLWSLIEAVLHTRERFWIVFVLSSVLSFYIHYFAFVFAALEAFVFFLLWKRKDGKIFRQAAVAGIASIILYIPWILKIAGGGLDKSALFWAVTSKDSWRLALEQLVGGNPNSSLTQWTIPTTYETIGMIVVPGMLLVGLWIAIVRKEVKQYSVLLAFAIMPGVIAYWLTNHYSPMFHTRFFIYSVPFLFLAVSYAVANLVFLVPEEHRRKMFFVVAIFVFLIPASILVLMNATLDFNSTRLDKEDWRGVALYLQENAKKGDVVTTDPRYFLIPLSYYFNQTSFVNEFSFETSDGAPVRAVGNDLLLNQELDNALPKLLGNADRVWVATTYWDGDIDKWMNGHYDKGPEKDFSQLRLFLYYRKG